MSILRSLNATALHARTADLCATNAWVEDNGFTVPAAYSSLSEEQWALNERVALCDLSARQVWSFSGADAASFLSFATLHDAAAMAPARAQETYWCDDGGFVRGQGTLVRRGATEFDLMTPVRDLAWMLDGAQGFEVELCDVTDQRAAIGVAGPLAAALLADTALVTEELHPGDVADVRWRSNRVTVLCLSDCRFALQTPAEDAAVVWDRLWRSGRALGLGVAGAHALDLARIEAGRLKPGVDWLPAQSATSDDKLCLPQDFGVSPGLTRRFNGVDALRRNANGPRRVAVQLAASEAVVTGPLTSKESGAGRVTSVAWSLARDEAVALAWVDQAVAKPGTVVQASGPSGPVAMRVTTVVQGPSA